MAHAHSYVYAETPHIKHDEHGVTIRVGHACFVMRHAEAIQLRNDLSRAITEAATAAAKALQSAGEAA